MLPMKLFQDVEKSYQQICHELGVPQGFNPGPLLIDLFIHEIN